MLQYIVIEYDKLQYKTKAYSIIYFSLIKYKTNLEFDRIQNIVFSQFGFIKYNSLVQFNKFGLDPKVEIWFSRFGISKS